jgi:hypothetical protein
MTELAHDYIADMADDFFNDRAVRQFEETPSGMAWCEMQNLIKRVRHD